MRATLLLASGCVLTAVAVPTQQQHQNNQNVFCDGRFALCTKAPCWPAPQSALLTSFSVTSAVCECSVIDGWSMGSGACSDREPTELGGRTYLISSYSNYFNTVGSTLVCEDPTTDWTFCLGAPCVVDPANATRAYCTCTIAQSAMATMGGDCNQATCKSVLWSGAPIAVDNLGNQLFYTTLKNMNISAPLPSTKCLIDKPTKKPTAKHG